MRLAELGVTMWAEAEVFPDRVVCARMFIHETLVEILLDAIDAMAGLYGRGRHGLRLEDRLEGVTRLAKEVNGQMEEESGEGGNREGVAMVSRIVRAHAAVGAVGDVNVAAAWYEEVAPEEREVRMSQRVPLRDIVAGWEDSDWEDSVEPEGNSGVESSEGNSGVESSEGNSDVESLAEEGLEDVSGEEEDRQE